MIFQTQYDLFKYLVMSFSLANISSSFQHYMNNILQFYLNIFCTTYIDNILIYSNLLSKHQKHMKLVLKTFQEADLQLNIDKCEFHKSEVFYLELLIITNGI